MAISEERAGRDRDQPWTLQGEWRLPKGRKLSGELSYDRTDLELTTRGLLDPERDGEIPVLHGWTNEGYVTLFRSRSVQSRFASHAEGSTVRAGFSLLGAHLTTRSTYKAVWIAFEDFEEWMTDAGIDWEDAPNGDLAAVRLRKWTPRIASIGNRRFYGDTSSPYRIGRERALIHFYPEIAIRYRKAVSFRDVVRDVSRLRELVSLLTGTNPALREVNVLPSGRRKPGEDRRVSVVWPSRKSVRGLDSPWHIISFRAFSLDSRTVLRTWFEERELDRTALDLYFAARGIDELPLELRYLCILQALERHHRRYYNGRYVSPGQYKPLEKEIADALPAAKLSSAHLQSLRTKIKFGNEKSLRNRLREMCGELSPTMFEKLAWDAKAISGVLADVRNDLTHYQTNARRKAAQAKLYNAVNASLAITTALFLRRLGFDEATIDRGLSRHHWLTATAYRFGPHGRPFGDKESASIWIAPNIDDAQWQQFVATQLPAALGVERLSAPFVTSTVVGSVQALGRWGSKTPTRERAKPSVLATVKSSGLAFPLRILVVDRFAYVPAGPPRPSPVPLVFVGSFRRA